MPLNDSPADRPFEPQAAASDLASDLGADLAVDHAADLSVSALHDDPRLPAKPLPEFHTLTDRIAAHALESPQRVALVCGEDAVSYAELQEHINRVAAALQADGAQPQHSIAICAGSSVAYLVVFLGALRAGLAVAPLAPGSTPAQLAQMVADCQAGHLFFDAGTAALLAGAPTEARRIALDDPAAFDHWAAAGRQPQPVALQPEWAFNIIYSSGTTGTPKGIVQSHAMRWAQVRRAGGA
jgi:long-chain acyl-CoA synthetase